MQGRDWFDLRMRRTPGLLPEHLALHDEAEAFGAAQVVQETCEGARTVVAELGGSGLLQHITGRFSLRGAAVLRESLAYHHGLLDFAAAMQGLGSYALTLAGAHPADVEAAAAGRSVFGFALTEPDAGSDLSAIQTRATATSRGWHIEGLKHLISNAPIADTLTVLARTDPAAGARGLSMFLVRRPEFACPREQHAMAFHPLGQISLDTEVPSDRLIGRPGEGYRLALSVLETFRTTVAAAACGLAGRALAETLSHVQHRRQFGAPLMDLAQVKAHVADMATRLEAARLMVYRSAAARDEGQERIPFESAAAKLVATETAQQVIDTAVQLHGGLGVLVGSTVERLYREVRALRIYEGTTDILKLVVAGALLA